MTKANIEFQNLTSENTALLNNIAPDVFDEDIKPKQLRAFLDDPRHHMVLAVSHGQIVGQASCFEYFHPDKLPQMFINEVGVTPKFQRKGIGRGLVQRLIDMAENMGCTYAWLGTDHDNVAGNACFGSIPDGDPPEQFTLYAWDLAED